MENVYRKGIGRTSVRKVKKGQEGSRRVEEYVRLATRIMEASNSNDVSNLPSALHNPYNFSIKLNVRATDRSALEVSRCD